MNNDLTECRAFADVYSDDIVIHSHTLTEHLLRNVLDILRKERLFGKLKKCTFAMREIEFCGFLVNGEGIRTHPDTVVAIQAWPRPQSVKDVRSFIGLAGFYQRFVKNFADIAHPLTHLFKKTTKWTWGPEQENAFQKLMSALAEYTRLTHPEFSQNFVVHIEASASALGATLSQETRLVDLRMVTCTSRKLNPAERNYPTH